ncbi:acylamino-acid-releasing enzyme isoform X2 [Monomorium pharaonis]|uniref:acylamino-acid-releasing enzyme isoform X2 n=1 Tax=Monomorium pharaonis TaxID=307658 RepID=UPI0017462029|nr:acylamino-acid-releasing enzyme isoform X2 [Monomorium pharaonis]XP_036138719.1 acylamino-acid-releasing enzyme isoform X2 [Monomorium pharaonis]
MALGQIKELVNIYKLLATYPSLSSAQILGTPSGRLSVQGSWTQRNLERKTDQRFLQNYDLNSDLTPISTGFPVDISTELMSSLTKNEERRAVLRQATIDNSTKQFIEIWDKQHFVKNYDLSALDVHGDVYTDIEFRSFEWSPDNTKVLYIAEKKLPKSEPFYKQKSLDKKDKDKKEDDETMLGNEYIHKPQWGEQLVGKHRPVVAVLDTTIDTITILSGIPDEFSPGQVIWTKDQDVIGVAWKHEPIYLGLTACTNRYSWVFLLKNGEYRKLSEDGCAVHSPRISPDGNYLVWLQREAGAVPHHNAHKLMFRDLRVEKDHIIEIVEAVRTSKIINHGKQFYGIYARLPRRCWSNDSEYLFFSTPQRNNIVSYIVNINTKDVTEIKNDRSSLSILDVKENMIAFLNTSLIQPSSLMIARFDNEVATSGNIPRIALTTPLNITGFEKITYEQNEYSYDNDDSIKQFNYIYFGPKSGKNQSVPFIVIPHGGPHSSFANTFSLESAFFILAGFAVVLVNYRGSTGMGSATVEYLQGKVGNVDVKDCITATQEVLKKYSWLDPKRLGLCGGSHGGFLVAHLSGQAPDLFKAVVAKNPVIDIATMFSISDIPDCRNALTKEEKVAYLRNVCIVEAGLLYNIVTGSWPEDTDMFVKMRKCSPIVYVDKVKAPTLVCIGTKDLRVPPSQGTMWYNRLKINKVKTKMLVYDDNHQLSTGSAEIDHIINDCLWLLEHTSKQSEDKK